MRQDFQQQPKLLDSLAQMVCKRVVAVPAKCLGIEALFLFPTSDMPHEYRLEHAGVELCFRRTTAHLGVALQ
ncbi:hypothetical protein D3C83_20240 [compost metagenome]